MNGYVRNKTSVWRHALKRSVGPNQKIGLDELYEQYGVKHDLEAGDQFVNWLRQVKLRDTSIWEIVYNNQLTDGSGEEVEKKEEKKADVVSPHVKKERTVDEIANMPVRTAREDLKKITDIKLLKYAYESARQLANKDTLCRMLRKRIQELEITRR